MPKKEPIEIRQLANGYIVMPPREHGMVYSDQERFVFQTFNGLVEWLGEHFDHRAPVVFTDPV